MLVEGDPPIVVAAVECINLTWRVVLFDVVRCGTSQQEDTAERTPLRTTLAHDQQCLQTFVIGLAHI